MIERLKRILDEQKKLGRTGMREWANGGKAIVTRDNRPTPTGKKWKHYT